jgi:hypothetical protein
LVGGVKASLTGSIGFGATQELTVVGGAHYLDGVWQPVKGGFNRQFTPSPFLIKAEGNAKAYAGPQLNFNIFYVAGPFVAVHGFVETEGKVTLLPPSFG